MAAVNAAFMPTQEEIDWAERVLEAAGAAQGAAVAVDGKMVDRPVILKAQSIREEARMRQARMVKTQSGEVIASGLHEFLGAFVEENAQLHFAIGRQFKFG